MLASSDSQVRRLSCIVPPSCGMWVAGKGRGLVLTGAVKKGDLLAACRPLAVASKHPIELEEGCCPTTLVRAKL